MAQIFLSYARSDADKAQSLAIVLEHAGHNIWWDRHIGGGSQYTKVIEEALAAADVVVVLWSAEAVESYWVRDEAAAGRDTGRLVPVTVDGSEPPLGFRQFQTMNLSQGSAQWKPAQLAALLDAIGSVASGNRQAAISPKPRPPANNGFFAALAANPWRLIALIIGLAIFGLGLFITRPWERARNDAPPPPAAIPTPPKQ